MAKKDVKKAEEAVDKVEETKQPKAEEKGTFKVKPKMRKVNKDEVIKVDLRKVNKEEVPKEEAQGNAEEKVEGEKNIRVAGAQPEPKLFYSRPCAVHLNALVLFTQIQICLFYLICVEC